MSQPASLAVVTQPPPTRSTPKTFVAEPSQIAQQPPLPARRPRTMRAFNPPTPAPATLTSTRVRPSVAKTGGRELANEKKNDETGDKVHDGAGGGRAGTTRASSAALNGGKKRQIEQDEQKEDSEE